MPKRPEWKVPADEQPQPDDYGYDLDAALSAVLSLSARTPATAFTAETLGTERAGNAVLIRDDGLVLTVGYLVTEADSIWLTTTDGTVVPGHVLGYDQATGFGLVQALGRLGVPALPLGRSAGAAVGEPVVIAGAGGRHRSVAAEIVARQEFAGYWEYVLDEALFVAPAHPHWGGTAVIDAGGALVGLGSLQLQTGDGRGARTVNMAIPIDLLPPILDDMLTLGRPSGPARPWLGLYATELDDQIVVMGLAGKGPAQQADVQVGDVVSEVAGERIEDLADLFRRIWALGEAGVAVPLTLVRDGRRLKRRIASSDRNRFLVAPQLH